MKVGVIFPDAEAWAVEQINDHDADFASTKVPDPRPSAFAVVNLDATSQANPFRQRALLRIRVFDQTATGAIDAAKAIAARLAIADGPTQFEFVSGPIPLPDPSEQPMCLMTVAPTFVGEIPED